MGPWCCQQVQVKHPWDIVLIVWENELSGSSWEGIQPVPGTWCTQGAVSCLVCSREGYEAHLELLPLIL